MCHLTKAYIFQHVSWATEPRCEETWTDPEPPSPQSVAPRLGLPPEKRMFALGSTKPSILTRLKTMHYHITPPLHSICRLQPFKMVSSFPKPDIPHSLATTDERKIKRFYYKCLGFRNIMRELRQLLLHNKPPLLLRKKMAYCLHLWPCPIYQQSYRIHVEVGLKISIVP